MKEFIMKYLDYTQFFQLPSNTFLGLVWLKLSTVSPVYIDINAIIFAGYMCCFALFDTICIILKTWKTPMEECYF